MLTSMIKLVVFIGALVAYASPPLVLRLLGEDAQGVQTDVARFLLTFASIVCSLMRPAAGFYVSAFLVALQLVLWFLYITEERYILLDGVDAAAEKQTFLFASLVCFAVLNALMLFGRSDAAKARFRARLVTFYSKHNPAKLKDVDELVKKYAGNEQLLFERLHRKYNSLSTTIGPDGKKHTKMTLSRDIDENEFLYMQEEEAEVEVVEDLSEHEDNTNAEEPLTVEDFIDQTEPISQPTYTASRYEKADGQSYVPPKLSRIATDYDDEVDGTPPPSPTFVPFSRSQSSAIQAAIADARRAQEERISNRIAQLVAQSTSKISDDEAL